MRSRSGRVLGAAAAVLAFALPAAAAPKAAGWHVPTSVKKLSNGLTVVVS